MFLRLGVAESDSQLEAALARFLPAVLLKTAGTSPAVQAKVSVGNCYILPPVSGHNGIMYWVGVVEDIATFSTSCVELEVYIR